MATAPSSNGSFQQTISQHGSGSRQPAMSLVRRDPEAAALISKLVKSREPDRFDSRKESSYFKLDQTKIARISENIRGRINDNQNMMELFPDLELAAQILVSSILSPKDMVNVDPIFRSSTPVFPPELSMKLIEIIQEEVEGHYELKSLLQEILMEILFETGSSIRAVIPEASVDEVINNRTFVSTESLRESLSDIYDAQGNVKNLGYLGAKQVEHTAKKAYDRLFVSTEEYRGTASYTQYTPHLTHNSTAEKPNPFLSTVEIVDNFMLLKMPEVAKKVSKLRSKEIIKRARGKAGVGIESGQVSAANLQNILYKGSQNNAKVFTSIPTKKQTLRKSIGRPLWLKLPSEAVIPIFTPGDVKRHIGYFVMIDEEGNPVNRNTSAAHMQTLSAGLSDSSSSMTSFLLQKARNNLVNNDMKALTLDQASEIFTGIIEPEILERLQNGVNGSNAQAGNNEDFYRIMLARTYANQFTRLVYVPGELVTYFAYKYHDNGVGKSLLDNLKINMSMRAMLLFSRVIAQAKNSINVTHVNMTLDPNDPDPQKSVEVAIHEIMKMRQQFFPLGINSPMDLVDWVQRSGIEFTFEGHPGLPQTKFDFENKNMQHSVPDTELEDSLRKQAIMALGLSPEQVDNSYNAEFATTVVSNNILLSKRVLKTQEIFTPQVSDMVRKIAINDEVIYGKLLDAVKEAKGSVDSFITDDEKAALAEDEEAFLNQMLEEFIETMEVDLPKPDTTSLANQSTAYDEYEAALDKALTAWVSSDIVTTETSGDISGSIDVVKNTVKMYFLRKWMAENGYMTELNDIVGADEDGKPNMDLYDISSEHIQGLTRSCVKFVKSLQPNLAAANTDMANMNVDASGAGSSSSDTPTDTGSDPSLDGGSDIGGMDDLPSF